MAQCECKGMDPPPSSAPTSQHPCKQQRWNHCHSGCKWEIDREWEMRPMEQRDDEQKDNWITLGDGAIPIVPTPSAYNPTFNLRRSLTICECPSPSGLHRLFHLPRVQMQPRGGSLRRFNAVATSFTSLASNHKPEVDFFAGSTPLPR